MIFLKHFNSVDYKKKMLQKQVLFIGKFNLGPKTPESDRVH